MIAAQLDVGRVTWQRESDVVIVGAGAAGLSAALRLIGAGRRVVRVTNPRLPDLDHSLHRLPRACGDHWINDHLVATVAQRGEQVLGVDHLHEPAARLGVDWLKGGLAIGAAQLVQHPDLRRHQHLSGGAALRRSSIAPVDRMWVRSAGSTHATSRALLAGTDVDHDHVLDVVRAALAEDLAWGPDITTQATIAPDAHGTAHVVTRDSGTIAGLGIAAAVPEILWATGDTSLPPADVTAVVRDGERVTPGQPVLRISAPLRLLLTSERTLLNLLCQLSGVATETARWVDALQSGANARPDWPQIAVRDTRKTVPGLPVLQKYAVRCGGGVNHRMGLGDAALIKTTTLPLSARSRPPSRRSERAPPDATAEIECDTLAQVTEALTAGADLILLDNMTTAQIRAAVGLARSSSAKLEASGGLTVHHAAEIAATGVDYVSVGALTHSAKALDLGLDLDRN